MSMPIYPADSVQQTNPIINDLPKVNSSQEARTALTRPSTRDVLWDKDENYFYMRVTDATGKIISFERYSYDPSPEPKPEDLFVSNERFNAVTSELKGGLDDVKESIQQLVSTIQQSNERYDSAKRPNRKHAESGSAVG